MRASRLPIAAALFLICASIPAQAELNKEGDLEVSFDGGLWPTRLPRNGAVPVAVRVAGNVKSANGNTDQLPQLRTISVAINRQGRLFDKGLPTCEVNTIQPTTQSAARKICGGALVGSGHVTVQVRIPDQPPFAIKANLLAFNGPQKNGHKLILAQAYARNPPGAFVLIFRLSSHSGVFGTVMSTTLPKAALSWAYLTHFDLTLRRTYSYRGLLRSFVSAACTAPDGFASAFFPFAKATYGFNDGTQLTTSVARRCEVR